MENSHAKSSDEVLAFFESNEEFGIAEQQVAANLHKYGFNGAPQRHARCTSTLAAVPDCAAMCSSLMLAELPAEESARASHATLHL